MEPASLGAPASAVLGSNPGVVETETGRRIECSEGDDLAKKRDDLAGVDWLATSTGMVCGGVDLRRALHARSTCAADE